MENNDRDVYKLIYVQVSKRGYTLEIIHVDISDSDDYYMKIGWRMKIRKSI